MHRRLPLTAFIAVVLPACGSYPADFPALDRGGIGPIAVGCADISGAYALVGADARQLNGGFRESFLRDVIPPADWRWPWDQVTIAGDASDSLIVTVSRSDSIVAAYRAFAEENRVQSHLDWKRLQRPDVRWSGQFARMSDSAYAANLEPLSIRHESRRVVHRGADYDCGGGWVRSARTVHDPGPDRRSPRPDTVIGEVLLARSTDGGLVAKAEYDKAQELTIWCGDGCRGIPLGTSRVARWSRWPKGDPATHTPDPRPWAVARPAVEPAPEPFASSDVDDRASRAYARVTDGIAITGHDASDRRALILSVTFTTQDALSRFLHSLDEDPALAEPRVIWIETAPGGAGSATVQVRGDGA